MLVVSPTPFSIPLNSANVPTEAVETKNSNAERIPESVATFALPNKRGVETDQKSSEADRLAKTNELRDNFFSSKSVNTDTTDTAETETNQTSGSVSTTDKGNQSTNSTSTDRQDQQQLAKDQAVIRNLASIDRQVKAHEQAHASVGGALASAPSFTYQTGPNGVRYAVAGEVSINTQSVPGNPQATLQRASQVARAALAPADPSSTDRRVASSAQAVATRARFEIAQLAAQRIQGSRQETQAKINGEDPVPFNSLESTTSFTGGRLRSALASDATDQVGGQVSASA